MKPVIKVDREILSYLQKQCCVQTQSKYLFTQLCDFILDENKEPNKMTREEAVAKATECLQKSFKDSEYIVDAIEALGLIKFDEVKEPSPIEKGLTLVLGTTKYVDLLKWLYDHGYHIVKNKLPTSQEKGPYVFFPNPDGPTKLNVSVLQSDAITAITTLKKYGYEIYRKDGTKA